MAVRIRLRRMGSRGKPVYRIVVANSTSPRDGRFIETIGRYDPCADTVEVNADRAAYWLGCGAQPSDTARALLKSKGIEAGAAAGKATE